MFFKRRRTIKPGYLLTLVLLLVLILLPVTYKILTQTVFAIDAPKGYWKLDEGVDDTCSGGANDTCDSTTNVNDLAKTNGSWRPESMCVAGKCLEFDGNGDYLSRTDDADFDF